MQLQIQNQQDDQPIKIELSPARREDMTALTRANQQFSTLEYMGRRTAWTDDDGTRWYEKYYLDQASVLWLVRVCIGGTKRLIGRTGVGNITFGPTGMKCGRSSMYLFDKKYWRKGIAKYVGMARTWYAFTQLGLTRLTSEVEQGNTPSIRALARSGYVPTHIERNVAYSKGKLMHLQHLECINPLEPFWSSWWGGEPIEQPALNGYERTRQALRWATANVTLP